METLLYYFFGFFIHLELIAFGFLLIGVLTLLKKKYKAAKPFILLSALPLFIIHLSPLGLFMIMHLENAIPRPTLPSSVEGIIILGGSEAVFETEERGESVYTLAGTRLFQGMEIAKNYPDAKIILTGNKTEVHFSEKTLIALGISKEKIIAENESRVTADHPEFLKKHTDPSKSYLLVTSAFHMPRSLGLFKKQRFNVIPYPVDYHTSGHFSLKGWLSYILQRQSGIAIKIACLEWAGLTRNYLFGLSDTLLPKG